MEANQTVPVLLADDLVLVREGVAALIEKSSRYRVAAQCGDGVEALRMMQAVRPRVAVLDLNLPKLYSLEVVRKAREMAPGTRCILLAARGDRKTVVEALRGGAGAYVLKSGPSRHLLDAMDQVLAGAVYVTPLLEMNELFFQSQRRRPVDDPLELLSAREHQVFSLLVEGTRAKEIAARLDLSPKTVDTYRASLMRKLDIHDVAGLVKFALLRDLKPQRARTQSQGA